MDEPVPGSTPTYPVPDATIAAEPGFLVVIAAATLGVLLFWRRRKPAGTTGLDD
jgi:hypothetical protein